MHRFHAICSSMAIYINTKGNNVLGEIEYHGSEKAKICLQTSSYQFSKFLVKLVNLDIYGLLCSMFKLHVGDELFVISLWTGIQ